MVPWNWRLCWSRGGAFWFSQCQSRSGRYAVARHGGVGFGINRSRLHWGGRWVLSCSLKPHQVGDGEKNGNTPISAPLLGVTNHTVQTILIAPCRCEQPVCPTLQSPTPLRHLAGIQTPMSERTLLHVPHSATPPS